MKKIVITWPEENPKGRKEHYFIKLIATAHSYFMPGRIDEANYVARGILDSKYHGFNACISHDPKEGFLGIKVSLARIQILTPSQILMLWRLQQLAKVARFDFDEDNRQLCLQTGGIYSPREPLRKSLSTLSTDLQNILSDDRLEQVLQN